MKKLLIVLIQALVIILSVLGPIEAYAQQQLVSDPEIYEKDYYGKQCKQVEFGPDFIKRFDINNDGLVDLVSNHAELSCDGVKGSDCTNDGCIYNFYVRTKEGGYIMIATAKLYSYDFVQYFGNMVFMFQMHPRYCDRTDATPCEMRVRVRGARMLTISKK